MLSNDQYIADLKYVKSLFEKDYNGLNIEVSKLNGMTNRNYLAKINHEQFVVRVAGVMTEQLINRKNEGFNSKLVSDININVKTLYFDDKKGTKIVPFLSNATAFTHQTIKGLNHIKLIAKKIKQLHNSNIQFINEFNVFNEFDKYMSLLKNKDLFFKSTPPIL